MDWMPRAMALTRLAMAWIFLWPFLDKTFGLGFSTPPERAWIHGGSPTQGFLSMGTHGPFAPAFQAIAGNGFVDALFMLGLLGIGVALALGMGKTIACASGAAMLVLMWLAALPPPQNPFLDDHLIYGLVLWLVYLDKSNLWSLAPWWQARAPKALW